VSVSWKVKNLNAGGKVDSSFFNWRFGSSTARAWTRSKITATSGDSMFAATIPAANGDSLVSYFVEAYGGGIYGASPDPSIPQFYQIRQSGLTIRDVQFTPYVNSNSGFVGDTVTVSGIITADTTDIKEVNSTRPQLWMASAAGAWNGVTMYGTNVGVGLDSLRRGDSLQVTGIVMETNGRTNIQVLSRTLIKRGVAVPAATSISMSGSGSVSYQDANRPVSGASAFEQWEGVLVKTPLVYLNITNADNTAGTATSNFGEFFISTTKAPTTPPFGIRVNDNGCNSYYADTNFTYRFGRWLTDHPYGSPLKTKLIAAGSSIASLTAIMDYSFSEYKLEPRKDDDFGAIVSSVNYQEEGVVAKNYELSQNYPNPFNPSTTIRYKVPEAGSVQLKIFNILGQEVMTLVDGDLKAGSYVVVFDASRLASGIYLYQLKTDKYSNVKKMMLLK
jgi:predicted extracellular nuclease